MDEMTFGTATHNVNDWDLSCKTTLTTLRFTVGMVAWKALRFWRQDTSTSGVELYRVNPDKDGIDMFARYADPSKPVDALVIAIINAAVAASETGNSVPACTSERYAQIELV